MLDNLKNFDELKTLENLNRIWCLESDLESNIKKAFVGAEHEIIVSIIPMASIIRIMTYENIEHSPMFCIHALRIGDLPNTKLVKVFEVMRWDK